jgi:S-DNA-T family DNA segregation ATPase FtsK/SpoIIIE
MARAAVAGRSKEESVESGGNRGREVGGIVLLGVALFAGLALTSFQFGAGNLMGPVGATIANAIYAGLGVGGYFAA